MTTYLISELAERTGVPATTLRFYESSGLLPAERTQAGYRVYDEPAVERLGFIAAAKRLGLPLDEIAALLRIRTDGACREVKADLRPRLLARLDDAELRRTELTGFIASLHAAVEHLDTLPDRAERCGPGCGFPDLSGNVDGGRIEDPPERWRSAPVACSLRDGLDERVGQWRSVLAGGVRESIPDGVRVTVPIDRLAAVAELAAAEQQCCPFFAFELQLNGPDLWLQVRAPAEGQDLVGGLFGGPVS